MIHDQSLSIELTQQFVALGTEMQDEITMLWLVTATILVLFMQPGFLLLEAGAVRSKNTVSVAQKNIADFVICGCIFLMFSSMLMFGGGGLGFIGYGGIDHTDPKVLLKLFYQFAFCATAATIVSGAVAERMCFRAYIFITILIALIIYPIFGRLVWGNTILTDAPAYLANWGFLDFAGSTVVHVTGGAAALAAVLVIGPRKGRFDEDGGVLSLPTHSGVLSLLGTLILVIGWFGFNGGLATPGSEQFARIMINTCLAMCFGGASALVVDLTLYNGYTHPKRTSAGVLGGLVAITAGCAYVDVTSAALIGVAGSITAITLAEALPRYFKIDDPVDAISIHAGAGVTGTILLGFLCREEYLIGTRFDFIMVQILGAVVAFFWAFGIIYIALKLVSKEMNIRVSPEEEALGLNRAEHDAMLDFESLIGALQANQKMAGNDLGSGDKPSK